MLQTCVHTCPLMWLWIMKKKIMFRPKLLRLSNAPNQIHFRKKKLECIWEALVRSRTHQLIWEKSGSHKVLSVLTWRRLNLASLLTQPGLDSKKEKEAKDLNPWNGAWVQTAGDLRGLAVASDKSISATLGTHHSNQTKKKTNTKTNTKTSHYICNMYHPTHFWKRTRKYK